MCEIFNHDYSESIAILEDKNHKDYKELYNLRSVAKTINFLIIYGGTAYTLSTRISTPERVYTEEECQVFMQQYFKKLKGVHGWIKDTKNVIRRTGEVQNFFGRYRRFPEIEDWKKAGSSYHQSLIEGAFRQGVNFIIQGTCADMFKIAMVRVHKFLEGHRSKMIMPIHDELVFYMHRDELSLLKSIKTIMEDFKFSVPMTTDVSYSPISWKDKKPLKLA